MGKTSNLKRAIYYLRRNGIKNTCYAIRERLSDGQAAPYVYICPSEEERDKQRARALAGLWKGEYDGIAFSVVVPAYRTDPKYLNDMITSVINQSYPCWELIVADATEDERLREVVEGCQKKAAENPVDLPAGMLSGSIRYVRLQGNGGISENTNQALTHVSGDYVGLLDHDDLLAPDALYEMAEHIREAGKNGRELQLLYSDEDKCGGDAREHFEPHFKEKFNLDLILSNNYICHFMVIKKELIEALKFRREYDGAQDYDLVLRAVSRLQIMRYPEKEELICHIPKVLYHWRCHDASTAENPRSKDYAYEAGRRALQDFADRSGIPAGARHLKHLGFYRLVYSVEARDEAKAGTRDEAKIKARDEARSGASASGWEEARRMLELRPDLGIVGGCLVRRGRIAGGRMDSGGRVLYQGLSVHYSGYMHRAVLTQDADAVDLRCFVLRGELGELFEEITGVSYEAAMGEKATGDGFFDAAALPEGADPGELSLRLCRAVRERGYRIAYIPYLCKGV